MGFRQDICGSDGVRTDEGRILNMELEAKGNDGILKMKLRRRR